MTTVQLSIVCLTVLAAVAICATAAARVVKDRTAREAFSATILNDAALALRAATEHLAAPMMALTDVATTLDDQANRQAPAAIGHRVTVHTKQPDDQTLFGLLVADYSDVLVLEDAEFVTAQGGRSLPGAQRIRWVDVSWVDVHAFVTAPTDAETLEVSG